MKTMNTNKETGNDDGHLRLIDKKQAADLLGTSVRTIEREVSAGRLAYYTGLRREEIGSLVWGDFDFETGFVTCPQEHVKNKEDQPLPLPDDLEEMLVAHWEASGRPGDSVKALKMPYRTAAMYRDFKAAGIAKKNERGKIVDFYSFRHSFAQRLKESRVPFAIAMRMMRHSDPKLLASVYGDQDAYALADHAAKLPGMSNGKPLSPDSSLETGVSGQNVAKPVANKNHEPLPESSLIEALRRVLSHLGATGQMAPAVGIEPTT